MVVLTLVAVSTGAFFGFAAATVLFEHKKARLEAEASRIIDLTIDGLKRLGMVGISVENVRTIAGMIDTHVPGTKASFDEDVGTIFFETEEPKDPDNVEEQVLAAIRDARNEGDDSKGGLVTKIAAIRAKKNGDSDASGESNE